MLPWLSLLAVVAAFAYPLFDFFSNRAKQPEYQAFPFVLAAIAYLAFQRLRAARRDNRDLYRSLVLGSRLESNASQAPPVRREAEPLNSAFQAEPGTSKEPSTKNKEQRTSRSEELNHSPLASLAGRGVGGEGPSLVNAENANEDAPEASPSAAYDKYLLRLAANLAFAFSSLVVLGGVVVWSPWLIFVGLVILLLGVVISLRVTHHTEGLLAVWALMWLLLPLPLNLDKELTTKLQLLSSWLSSQLLEAVGVLHLLRGNNLHIASKELFVDEACSGIVSLITIISAIAIYCVWLRRSLVHTLAMVLLGIGWTVLMNTLRIVTIAVALDWYQVDWSAGTSHTVLAVVLFVVSLGVLKLLDGFLNEFFQPIDTEDHPMGEEQWQRSGWLIQMWDRWFANARSEDELIYSTSGKVDQIVGVPPLGGTSLVPGSRLESTASQAPPARREAEPGTSSLTHSPSGRVDVVGEGSLSLASGYRLESNDSQALPTGREAEPLDSAFQAEPGTSKDLKLNNLEPRTTRSDELSSSPLASLAGRGAGGEGPSLQPFESKSKKKTVAAKSFNLPVAVVAILMIAGVLQFWTVPPAPAYQSVRDSSFDQALALQESDNPCQLVADAKLIAFKPEAREAWSIWGEHSRVWTYQDATGKDYQLSLDFLFGPDWHDIKYCYPGVGWTVSNYKVRDESIADQHLQSAISFDLSREDAMVGYATFLGFKSDGSAVMRLATDEDQVIAPTARTMLQNVLDRFKSEKLDTAIGPYYQLQVVTFGREITDEQKQIAKQLLLEARKTLAEKLKK